jgi:hypothetical protein
MGETQPGYEEFLTVVCDAHGKLCFLQNALNVHVRTGGAGICPAWRTHAAHGA